MGSEIGQLAARVDAYVVESRALAGQVLEAVSTLDFIRSQVDFQELDARDYRGLVVGVAGVEHPEVVVGIDYGGLHVHKARGGLRRVPLIPEGVGVGDALALHQLHQAVVVRIIFIVFLFGKRHKNSPLVRNSHPNGLIASGLRHFFQRNLKVLSSSC
jgi:hypothetical protein